MRVVRGLAAAKEALCRGRGLGLDTLPAHVQARIAQTFGQPLTPLQVVELVLAQVRQRGDEAVRELTRKLDGFELSQTQIPPDAISQAYKSVPRDLVEAMRLAAQRIRQFHQACLPRSWMDFSRGYGQMVSPVGRVGAYIPGGTAAYPSTVLMSVIPARVAGVKEVVLCTPSKQDGLPSPAVLVAADIAGVDRVYRIGGAQAIAAMAYGTESVPRVDMVCGPGNIFVTLAKKLVFGDVGIDGLYGPTETLVIADETANPTMCAADLLAQAEHDALARPVLVTTSEGLASTVQQEVEVRLRRLERASIARAALDNQGHIAIVDSLDEALELANDFAPEHLSLMVRDPWPHVGKVRNAGAVFVGEFSHEVLGDYVAGPSHVMPTGGTARFSSGLGVHSFIKFTPVVALDRATSRALARAASLLGRVEGLTAHAEAAEIREELL